MQVGILATNNGKHSDAKLAAATAAQLIEVGADSAGQQVIDARRLENQFLDILEDMHKKISEHEVHSLADVGHAHLSSELASDHIDAAIAQILAAADASPFASWFAKSEVRDNVTYQVGVWGRTNMHMHRDWHTKGFHGHGTALKANAKHDPNNRHVKAWVATQTMAGPPPSIVEVKHDAFTKETMADLPSSKSLDISAQ